MGEAMSGYNEAGRFGVSAERLSKLIGLVKEGVVSLQAAKRVYPALVDGNEEPRAVAERLGLIQVGDANALGAWVEEVVAANPSEVERFRGGEVKLMGFFVGQVMKKSGGKADPKAVQPLLIEKLRK
jgi:aspartyl-tRNA(Asn)/glutamyl-tRNA(Gln) amidotransferase subunit B